MPRYEGDSAASHTAHEKGLDRECGQALLCLPTWPGLLAALSHNAPHCCYAAPAGAGAPGAPARRGRRDLPDLPPAGRAEPAPPPRTPGRRCRGRWSRWAALSLRTPALSNGTGVRAWSRRGLLDRLSCTPQGQGVSWLWGGGGKHSSATLFG